MNPHSFNFPPAPDTPFPSAHVWADVVIWAVAIGLIAYCIVDGRRTRSPLGIVLLLGGAIAYLNEPVDDILGLVHHPRPGQNIVLDTIGPVPMWGLPTYIVFFGAISYIFLREIQTRGFSLRAFWTGIAITFVIDLLIELPLLYVQGGLYQYYGDTPMTVLRFPVYWLLINTTGPILCAAVLHAVPGYFKGWRAPSAVGERPSPRTTDAPQINSAPIATSATFSTGPVSPDATPTTTDSSRKKSTI